jgi:hypothetical protein
MFHERPKQERLWRALIAFKEIKEGGPVQSAL